MVEWTLGNILYIVVITLDVILGVNLYQIRKKKELELTRKYFTGIVLFFFAHALTRTLFLIYELLNSDGIRILEIFYFGTALGLLCVVFIVFSLESTVLTKSKRVFTIYGIIGVCIMLLDIFMQVSIGDNKLSILVQYFTQPILVTVIIFVYLKLAIQSTGRPRIAAIVMIIAVIFFGLGEMSNTKIAYDLMGDWLNWGSPIFIIISLILFFISVISFYKND